LAKILLVEDAADVSEILAVASQTGTT